MDGSATGRGGLRASSDCVEKKKVNEDGDYDVAKATLKKKRRS